MNKILLDAPMPIITPRLTITMPQHGLGAKLTAAKKETLDQLKEYFPWAHYDLDEESDEVFLREKLADFYARVEFVVMIFDKADNLLGMAGIHPISWLVPNCHIGYWLCKSAQGKGYMQEAVIALTKYAIEQLKFKAVQLHIDAENEQSLKVARSVKGFVEEARIRGGIDKPNCDELRTQVVFVNTSADDLEDLGVSW